MRAVNWKPLTVILVKLIVEHYIFTFSEAYMLLFSWIHWFFIFTQLSGQIHQKMWCTPITYMGALLPWALEVLRSFLIFALKMHPQFSQGFDFRCLSLKLHLLSRVVIISAYCVFFIPFSSKSRYLSPCYHFWLTVLHLATFLSFWFLQVYGSKGV